MYSAESLPAGQRLNVADDLLAQFQHDLARRNWDGQRANPGAEDGRIGHPAVLLVNGIAPGLARKR